MDIRRESSFSHATPHCPGTTPGRSGVAAGGSPDRPFQHVRRAGRVRRGERLSGWISAETNIKAFIGTFMDNRAITSTHIRFCQTIVAFLA